jgi:hypothetical protein
MRNKILLILVSVFIILSGISFWYWQKNTYSKEDVKVEIIGPESAGVGEEVKYIVKIKNNGTTKLEEPRLVFEFPSFSLPADGELFLRKTIEKEKFDGAIYPGEEDSFEFRAYLFGEAGDTREAKATLYARPKNLTATYYWSTSHITVIRNVPLSFEFDLPSEIEAGKKIEFSLNYFSSIDFPLTDVRVKIEYPPGFSFIESEPKGLSDNEWPISVLNKAEGGRIIIRGMLSGEAGEERTFKAEVGTQVGQRYVSLKRIFKRVIIVEPSIYIDQMINGSRDYIANPGDLLHYQIIFRNIGDKAFENLFLVVKLKGDLLDLSSIKAPDGEFGPGDNSIIWDGRNISSLKFLEPGEQGEVEFWIKLKEDKDSGIRNPKIENEIRLGQAKRIFTVKINSKVELTQEIFIDDEIFGSPGPLPPKVGQESLFTVIWRVKNYYNQLKDVKVKATLPVQVNLTGQIMPQKLTFDPNTREILWEIGELPPGTGIEKPYQIAFQISFKPTSDQVGKPAVLINEASISGDDEWTEEPLQITIPPLTTEAFGGGDIEKVILPADQ